MEIYLVYLLHFLKQKEAREFLIRIVLNLYIQIQWEKENVCLDEKSNAFIITPGGIGTFDEFYEILTLKQLGRQNKPIVLYNINNYYENLENMMKVSIEKSFITKDCKDLYKVFNTAEDVLSYIENYDEEALDISRVKIR